MKNVNAWVSRQMRTPAQLNQAIRIMLVAVVLTGAVRLRADWMTAPAPACCVAAQQAAAAQSGQNWIQCVAGVLYLPFAAAIKLMGY